MPISRLGLDVIVISVTEILPLYHIGLTFVIVLVNIVIGIHDARARLSKGVSVFVRFLMSFSVLTVVLILMLQLLLIALKSWRFVLLHVTRPVVMGIRGISSLVLVLFRMPRGNIVSATSSLIPAEPKQSISEKLPICNLRVSLNLFYIKNISRY